MDSSVFSFSKINNSFLIFFFLEDENLWGRASYEYHKNWATMNSNCVTVVCVQIYNTFLAL